MVEVHIPSEVYPQKRIMVEVHFPSEAYILFFEGSQYSVNVSTSSFIVPLMIRFNFRIFSYPQHMHQIEVRWDLGFENQIMHVCMIHIESRYIESSITDTNSNISTYVYVVLSIKKGYDRKIIWTLLKRTAYEAEKRWNILSWIVWIL